VRPAFGRGEGESRPVKMNLPCRQRAQYWPEEQAGRPIGQESLYLELGAPEKCLSTDPIV
jgi:hypothetical protein